MKISVSSNRKTCLMLLIHSHPPLSLFSCFSYQLIRGVNSFSQTNQISPRSLSANHVLAVKCHICSPLYHYQLSFQLQPSSSPFTSSFITSAQVWTHQKPAPLLIHPDLSILLIHHHHQLCLNALSGRRTRKALYISAVHLSIGGYPTLFTASLPPFMWWHHDGV